MIRVGITGGIGSGKSLVCRVFETIGIPVFYADDEARTLSNEDPEIRNALISIFGKDIYRDNKLNRSYMAQFIFQDKLLLEKVNHIIHPRVADYFKKWYSAQIDKPYVIQESAILFESGAYESFSQIVAVTAPDDLRLKRVMIRPNMSAEKFRLIVANQINREQLINRADHLIINDDKTLLIPQIIKLHHLFLSLSSNEKNQ